jgi:hypothetical protein
MTGSTCPKCSETTMFEHDSSVPFGWRFRCSGHKRRLSRKEKSKKKKIIYAACTGTIGACKGSWLDNSKSYVNAIFFTFAWVCRMRVTDAGRAASCTSTTAVDYYSMCREVAEVMMSHAIAEQPLGRPGMEVEVDECYLTRRKYNEGRITKTGTVTILGLYERHTDLGFHLQVVLYVNFTFYRVFLIGPRNEL